MIYYKSLAITAAVICVLSGCFDSQLTREWNKYPERIQTLAETWLGEVSLVSQNNTASFNFSDYPTPPSAELSLISALSIQACDLQSFIGERNSSLGRVQDVQSRFIYELKLLKTLKTCDISSITNLKTQQKVKELKAHKEKYWPAQVKYFLTHAKIHKNWLRFQQKLLENRSDSMQNHIVYLNELAKISQKMVEDITEQDISQFMRAAQKIENDHYLARMFYTIYATHLKIGQVEGMINKLNINNICLTSTPKPEVDYLKNVLTKYYAAILQPHLANIQRQADQILPLLQTIYSNFESDNEFYRLFLSNQEQSYYHNYKKQIKSHALSWQKLLKSCSIGVNSTR
ncbi:DUF3080 family protein [Gayadomonas joobiniege]|uniref:DUF3080 family protein n=1 Tax=Gayadomonas joobiniege TaxID=1234606 RepID=UPI00036179A0|nr:DUF3080 family protein [Gayadomonas joobiniege]